MSNQSVEVALHSPVSISAEVTCQCCHVLNLSVSVPHFREVQNSLFLTMTVAVVMAMAMAALVVAGSGCSGGSGDGVEGDTGDGYSVCCRLWGLRCQ